MAARVALVGRAARTLGNIVFSKHGSASPFRLRDFHASALSFGDAVQVKMPSLSPTMYEGNIVQWHKQEGDSVAPGDILCDIQTDKAVVGFEIDEEGILAKILMPSSSEIIKIGTLIALMVDEGEDWQNVEVPATAVAPDGATEAPVSAEAPDSKPTSAESESLLHGFGPAARTLLDLYKININEIEGTGPHKNIIKGDILKYIKNKNLQPAPVAPPVAAPVTAPVAPPPVTSSTPPPPVSRPPLALSDDVEYIDLELSNMRKIIAKRLTESKSTTPHAYSTIDCGIGRLTELRKDLIDAGKKVSMNDFIIKAAAIALQRVPQVNALWSEDGGRVLSDIDISVAVATESGLITPIVKDAINLGVEEISSVVKELAGRAKVGKLKPAEFQGGTFTISNLGMFGVTEFTAVINPPQACIMAVGTSRVELDLEGNPQTRMKVTLSADARMVDEFLATQFLEAFRETIENPMLMISQGTKYNVQKLFAK